MSADPTTAAAAILAGVNQPKTPEAMPDPDKTKQQQAMEEGRILDLLHAWGEAEAASKKIAGEEMPPENVLEMRAADVRPLDPEFKRLGYPDSDEGAAARFVAWMGDNVLWCYDHPQAGKTGGVWLVWHPERGWLVDTLGVVKRLAILCGRYCASPESQGVDQKWAAKMGNCANLNSMLSLVKTVRSVSHDLLDSDPYSLAVKNGVIDLKTGELHPFSKCKLITRRCSIPYNPDAKPTAVLSCFENNYDPEDLAMLQEFLGSCLNGAVRDRLLLYWTGPSGNGKTTATKAMHRMMGDYATQVAVDLYTTSATSRDVESEMAQLSGRRFVYAPECDEKNTLSEARIKYLTGADDIRYRALYCASSVSRACAKHVLYGNKKPRIEGRDKAFWRRLLVIEATGGVDESSENPNLQESATTDPEQLSGLLNWLLEGHARWVKNGLRVQLNARAMEARKQYEKEEDTTGAFLEECCQTGKDLKTRTSVLYKAYRDWAADQGMRIIQSQKQFSANLTGDFERAKIRGVDYWKGIAINAITSGGVINPV